MNVLARLTVEQVASLLSSLSSLAEKRAISKEDDFFSKKCTSLSDFSFRMTKASNKNRAISKLDAFDAARDDVLVRLGTVLEGHAAMPFEENVEAAKTLLSLYAKYGKSAAKEAYATESAKIKSLLLDLDSQGAQAAAKVLLGVSELIAALKKAQADFDEENTRVTKEITAVSQEENAYTLKKPAISLVNDEILPYLSMMAKVKGGEYAQLLKEMETEIKRANAAVSRAKVTEKTEEATK